MFSFRRLVSSSSKRRLFSTNPATLPTALPAHAAPGDRSGFIHFAVHKDNVNLCIGLLGTAVAAGCILFQLRSVSVKVDKVGLGLKSLEDKMGNRIQSLEDKISLKFDNQSRDMRRDMKDIERHLANLIISTRQQSHHRPLQPLPNKGDGDSSEEASR
jgi:hypothetical protein